MMVVWISPLGPDFISLKDAAMLWAREMPLQPYEAAMTVLIKAIFQDEFDKPEMFVGWNECNSEYDNDRLYEKAISKLTAGHYRDIGYRQKGGYCETSASRLARTLFAHDGLPGDKTGWRPLFPPEASEITDRTLEIVSCISFDEFPDTSREFLGQIQMSTPKLRAWLAFKGYDLPRFLKGEGPGRTTADTGRSEELHVRESQTQGRGRPRKNWEAIGDITDKVSKGKRELTRKRLAGQVLEEARESLPPEEIPSESTLYTRLPKLTRNGELSD